MGAEGEPREREKAIAVGWVRLRLRNRRHITSDLPTSSLLGPRATALVDRQMPRENVYQANLSHNDSRYVWNRAMPEPEFLDMVWGTWMVVAFCAALASIIIIVGVLHSKEARSNVFNLLIVFLCLPDFVFSGLCAITCALSYSASEYTPIGGAMGCEWQSFYVIFGFTGSMWMQVVIATELRHVLRCSHGRRAYMQPSLKQVLCRAGAVYAGSLFVASWPFISAIPIHADTASGMACVPLADDVESEVFLWVVMIGLAALAPLFGIFYLA